MVERFTAVGVINPHRILRDSVERQKLGYRSNTPQGMRAFLGGIYIFPLLLFGYSLYVNSGSYTLRGHQLNFSERTRAKTPLLNISKAGLKSKN